MTTKAFRKLRKEVGVSQSELADALSLTKQQVSVVESCAGSVRPEWVEALKSIADGKVQLLADVVG